MARSRIISRINVVFEIRVAGAVKLEYVKVKCVLSVTPEESENCNVDSSRK